MLLTDSNPDMDRQIKTVYDTLQQLEVKDKIVVTLFNKCDKLQDIPVLKDLNARYTINISAKTGEGLEKLDEVLQEIIRESRIYIERCFGYNEAGKIQLIREHGQLMKEEYTQDGIEIQAYVPQSVYGKLV